MTALRTRKPTGAVPWPLILIEGSEKAGKSWACAELSTSPKVGQTYWLDLGEGSADEYGAIPGARYLVVEHDGSWRQIIEAVEAIHAEATAEQLANRPPVVLVLDSITAEWELLKDWAASRARERLARKGRKLDPDAEPQISMDLWNDANARHRKLMTLLMTFPGIAVVTARGKDVAALDSSGRPVEGSKEYKVEGQKNLAYDATVWLRVSRDHPPLVVGARSVHNGVRPGVDKPKPAPGLTLERLIFDILRCNPAEAHVRDLVQPQGTEMMSDSQRSAMFARWGQLGMAGDDKREERLSITAKILEVERVESTNELTHAEAAVVIDALDRKIAWNARQAKHQTSEVEAA